DVLASSRDLIVEDDPRTWRVDPARDLHQACEFVANVAPRFRLAVQQQVAATARSRELAANRAGRARSLTTIVDPVVRDPARQLLLQLPTLVEQVPYVVEPPFD